MANINSTNSLLSPFNDEQQQEAIGENNFSEGLLTFAAVMTFIIMTLGLFGNFLTVFALLKCPKVRNVAAAFIISLCLADLIFCALVLPFAGIRFIQGTWTHGEILCRVVPFVQYGNIGVSLLCIGMITINRYVMIAHHSLYARIYKRHWIALMIAFCWIFSYGMQLPTLFGIWGRFDYDPKLATCSIMSDVHGHSSKTFLFIIAFVIPCVIIIACYAKIFWVVHQSEMRLKEHANKQNSIPNNLRPTNTANTSTASIAENAGAQQRVSSISDSSSSNDLKSEMVQSQQQKPTRIKDQREVRAKRNEWRITEMVLAIFLSFVICYLPITVAKVADKNVHYPAFHIISYIMLYLSACINPIIYVIMNKQYRKAYKTVLLCEPARILLPFGKGSRPVSGAAEKWKDIGLSNNNSRTIVSQMSAAEQQTSSQTTTTPTIGLELISTPTTVGTSTMSPSALFMKFPLPTDQQQQPQQSLNNKKPTMNDTRNGSTGLINQAYNPIMPTLPPALRYNSSNKDYNNRMTLVGDDIILEEEEEEALTNSNENIEQKKIPCYGPNINVIPANNDSNSNAATILTTSSTLTTTPQDNTKLTTKLTI